MPPKTERDGAIITAPSRLVETVRLTPTETPDEVAERWKALTLVNLPLSSSPFPGHAGAGH